MVACCQRFSVLVQNYHGTRLFGKLLHIFRQTCHTRRYGRFIVSRKFRTFQSTIILITLKLTAHQSTEINIYLTVIILKYGRIHGITSPDRIRFRHKRAVRRVTDSHSQTEDVRMVFGREIKIILSVLFTTVAIPHLTLYPRHIRLVKNPTMVCHISFHHIFQRENMIVAHIKMCSPIIFGNTALPIVRRINIYFTFKHMYRRVCHIISRNQISLLHIVNSF